MMRFKLARLLAATGCLALAVCLANALPAGAAALVDGSGDPAVASSENGKYFDKDGNPTFKVGPDGTVDWATYSGFRRYHSECHVCHGPEAQGSTYAPALVDSVKTMDYPTFLGIVASGQQNVRFQGNSVMPALGDNKNVMCYIDDIYIYIKALSDAAIPRGRPAGRVDKTAVQGENEKACSGG